jgi:protein-S-isoprenylcysteine O-methyltransferase Ste14
MIVNGVILFLSAGSLMYWEAWVYLVGSFVLMIFIGTYFLKKDPELMSRRIQYKEKEPSQKTVILRISGPLLYVLSYLIPGLDYRYHWSTVPVSIIIASNAIVFLGLMCIFFVFKENSYTASIIQVEKEQKVITTGPYAVVRHPMYVGLLLILLFAPFALGSYWALIPFLPCIPMLILRIINEEKVLLRDLPGYKDYCLKTCYRLVPLIW